jgi:glycerol-3-phosphate dehydrogenase
VGKSFFPDWKRTLRPSKGVHLTFNRDRFQLHDAVVMAAENRIVFAIPRHEMIIVGTTDTDYPDDPEKVRADRDDVAYLLQVVERYFPGSGISGQDIVACYAGVRPLIDDGSSTESKTSREHAIWTNPHGVTFVAGGKYTTYRNMAQQTMEEVLVHFPIEDRVQFSRSDTLEALNPLVTEDLLERARREQANWARQWRLPLEVTSELAERHGMEAEGLIASAFSNLGSARDHEEWMWCAEALHAIDNTMCLSLTDFYLRRTHLFLARADHGLPFAPAIARVMGERLGWNATAQKEQINALQNQMLWDLASVNPIGSDRPLSS